MTIEIDQTPLAQLQTAVDRCGEIGFQVSLLNAQLAKLNAEKDDLTKVTIPKLMKDLNVVECTMSTGEVLKLSKTLNVTIISSKEESAYTWLRDNKHGEVIKHEVSVVFKDAMQEDAEKLLVYCQKKGYAVKKVITVPWNTLSAAIRKYDDKQKKTVPTDIFKMDEKESVTIKMV